MDGWLLAVWLLGVALAFLWADGFSAAQIAAELGGVTRNAVIGKVYRLGLEAREPRKTNPRRRRRMHRPAPRKLDKRSALTGLPLHGAPSTPPEPDRQSRLAKLPLHGEPLPRLLSIEQLSACACRFPIGDPRDAGFGFCGHEAEADAPYCAYHLSVAYEAGSRRRHGQRGTR